MLKFVLLPIDQFEKDKKIILYAAGDVGKLLLRQIRTLNYGKLVCFADANAEQIKEVEGYPCIEPDQIINYIFDYIIIAKRQKNTVKAIYDFLLRLAIPKEKIILLGDQYELDGWDVKEEITPSDVNWKFYYKEAEEDARLQYETYLRPLFDKYITSSNICLMDFGCGEGRIVEQIKDMIQQIICCDLPNGPIEVCRKRFKEDSNITYAYSTKDGIQLENETCNAVYSWDAMVHFGYKFMDFYLQDLYRVLKPDGIAILHHSNLKNAKSVRCKEEWMDNTGSRSNFSKEEFVELAKKSGFQVIEQKIINWSEKDIDCISVVKK